MFGRTSPPVLVGGGHVRGRPWPHERSLVHQLSGKPFALLGVHGNDYPPKKLKEVMDKEKLSWRSLSSRAISSKLSARGTPTYYILVI